MPAVNALASWSRHDGTAAARVSGFAGVVPASGCAACSAIEPLWQTADRPTNLASGLHHSTGSSFVPLISMPQSWRKFGGWGISKVHSRCRAHTLARSLYTDTGTCFILTGEGKGFSLAKAQRGIVTPNCNAMHGFTVKREGRVRTCVLKGAFIYSHSHIVANGFPR